MRHKGLWQTMSFSAAMTLEVLGYILNHIFICNVFHVMNKLCYFVN